MVANQKLAYPLGIFMNAMHAMAVMDASLRDRIAAAYSSFHHLPEEAFDDFPMIKMKYRELLGMFNRYEDRSVGDVRNTLNKRTPEDLRAIAELIGLIDSMLTSLCYAD